jgi:transposase
MDNMREELKTEVAKLGPRGRGRPYPKGLLEKVLSYTVARRRQGAKLIEVAVELGLHNHTLSRWLGEKRAAKRFDRVEVVATTPAAAAPVASRIIVHGPRGLRIEGLELAAVAELVRRVGE